MVLKVIWTEAALSDIEAAAAFIARDSPHYASVLIRESDAAAASLDILSKRGRVVPETNQLDLRELFVCNYRLIYKITTHTVFVVGFIHGSRDLWAVWKQRR